MTYSEDYTTYENSREEERAVYEEECRQQEELENELFFENLDFSETAMRATSIKKGKEAEAKIMEREVKAIHSQTSIVNRDKTLIVRFSLLGCSNPHKLANMINDVITQYNWKKWNVSFSRECMLIYTKGGNK